MQPYLKWRTFRFKLFDDYGFRLSLHLCRNPDFQQVIRHNKSTIVANSHHHTMPLKLSIF